MAVAKVNTRAALFLCILAAGCTPRPATRAADGDASDGRTQLFPPTPDDLDGDRISNHDEGAGSVHGGVDTDGDGVFDHLDADSDGDGFEDLEEAGDTALETAPFDTDGDGAEDYRDRDSDADGLSDDAEWTAMTSRTTSDTDNDGYADLIEIAATTDPKNARENPRARGDFVFIVPYEDRPQPGRDTVELATSLRKADVYFLVDTTGSMAPALRALQLGLQGRIIPAVRRAIPEAWFGVGGFEDYPVPGGAVSATDVPPYGSTISTCLEPTRDELGFDHDVPFYQYLAMSADEREPLRAVSRFRARCGGDVPEAAVPALFAVATGDQLGGFSRYGGISSAPPACATGGRGGACFRGDAIPIFVLVTDSAQHNSPTCTCETSCRSCDYDPSTVPGAPTYGATIAALREIDARVIGVDTTTEAFASGARNFLERLAADTTVASGVAGAPSDFVVRAPDGEGLGDALASSIPKAANVPLDVSVYASDIVDVGDSLNAVDLFIDHIEARATPMDGRNCALALRSYDRVGIDDDEFHDTLEAVRPGSSACFDIVVRSNTMVPPDLRPRVYRARLTVIGEGTTPLDEHTIYFVVPPRIPRPTETPI